MKNFLLPCLVMPVLGGCGSTPIAVAPPDPHIAAWLSGTAFAGAPASPSAFDARTAEADWASDDTIVFGLRLAKGEQVHRWLLKLEVLIGQTLLSNDPDGKPQSIQMWAEQTWHYTVTSATGPQQRSVTSPLLPVVVTVSDENGVELTKSFVNLPSGLLGRGLLPAVDVSLANLGTTPPPSDANVEPIVQALLGVIALLNVVQEDDAIADYFWQVVEKPGLWSLVTNLGARATLSMPFEQGVPATSLPPHLPATPRAIVVPLRIDVNGSPALLADIIAVDASRPYALCGGMVAAVARHPSKPDLTFEMQLLSARLGKQTKARIELDAQKAEAPQQERD